VPFATAADTFTRHCSPVDASPRVRASRAERRQGRDFEGGAAAPGEVLLPAWSCCETLTLRTSCPGTCGSAHPPSMTTRWMRWACWGRYTC